MFPALASDYIFPALASDYMFSRAYHWTVTRFPAPAIGCQRLHVFRHLQKITCFPALAIQLHVSRRLSMVTWFPALTNSCTFSRVCNPYWLVYIKIITICGRSNRLCKNFAFSASNRFLRKAQELLRQSMLAVFHGYFELALEMKLTDLFWRWNLADKHTSRSCHLRPASTDYWLRNEKQTINHISRTPLLRKARFEEVLTRNIRISLSQRNSRGFHGYFLLILRVTCTVAAWQSSLKLILYPHLLSSECGRSGYPKRLRLSLFNQKYSSTSTSNVAASACLHDDTSRYLATIFVTCTCSIYIGAARLRCLETSFMGPGWNNRKVCYYTRFQVGDAVA